MNRAGLFRRYQGSITHSFRYPEDPPDCSMESPDTRLEHTSPLSRSFYALPVILGLLGAAFYSRFWLSHDDSWYLIATRKFLEGQRLYVDIMEVNPPLNFYLTAPALLFADATGLGDTVAYVLQVSALCALSGLWLVRLLRQSNLDKGAALAILLPALAGLFVLPIGEFAQREHLLFVFALPYFCYVILGGERVGIGRTERFLLGLIATLGLALKPYFLLIPAALVLVGPVRLLLVRAFSAENVGLALGLLGYAAFTVMVHPEFFSDILTVAQRVYWAFGFSASGVLLRGEIFAVVIFLYIFTLGGIPEDRASRRFAAAVLASLASYLIQFKGWNYQLIPMLYFLLAGSVWVAREKRLFEGRKPVPQAAVVAMVLITLGAQLIAGPYRSRTLDAFAPHVEGPGETIMVYSTNVSAAFPFVNAVQGQWAGRYPAQWTIPGAWIDLHGSECPMDEDYCGELVEILDDIRTANTEDLLSYRPDVVFVDEREDKSYFHGEPFDYIAFQKEDARFADAWADYEQVGLVGEGYAVWRRKPASGE